MRFSQSLKTIAISAVGVGLVSLALSAHPGQAELPEIEEATYFAQGMEPGDGAPPWLGELNLSAEQMQRIKAIHEQYKPQVQANRQAAQAVHEELRNLMRSNASTTELRQKHEQMQSLHQQGGDLRFESMLAIREVLTPEQRQQAGALMEQRHDRMKDRMQQNREERRERRGDRFQSNS